MGELHIFLRSKSDEFEDMSDAMWFEMMQEAVTEFNNTNGTHFDKYDSVMAFIESDFNSLYSS